MANTKLLLSDAEIDAKLTRLSKPANSVAHTEELLSTDELGNFLFLTPEPKPESTESKIAGYAICGLGFGALTHFVSGGPFWSSAIEFGVVFGLLNHLCDKLFNRR